MAFLFMKKYQSNFPVRKMARVFGVSISGFYSWLSRKPGLRLQRDMVIVERIRVLQKKHKGRYGSPRMTADLRDENIRITEKKVAKLMKNNGLAAKNRKKWVNTTNSKHDHPIAENILNRDFTAVGPGYKWVSDITYLRTTQGWVYLTTVIDLWDRKVIGWALSTDMDSIHVVRALEMACMNRQPMEGLIFHSDRGVQYGSKEFRDALALNCPKVRQSMSRKGNCWDNACAESFFKTLKRELEGLDGRSTRKQVQLAVFEYIEIYYNRLRRHSHLGNITPRLFKKAA
jgi:putative transposase